MTRKKKTPAPPVCTGCNRPARLTNGAEIYPHRGDLREAQIWVCDGCGAYVGCHRGSTRPLGTPAGTELRNARSILHNRMIDPLWRYAHMDYGGDLDDEAIKTIRRRARIRVYEFLADRLGITRDEAHTGLFDLETCRRAWRALQGVTYREIKEWAKPREEERRAKEEARAA